MKPPVPSPKAMLVGLGYKSDWQRHRDRNCIELMFNRLKQVRHITTRYDKTALSFISFLDLAPARF
ncbi:transposase [Gluconobacter cerinus]|uniref:transposase n=1 Tax=Gluconobacter cerinus TaxID=38307 RepID=UPI001B8C0241|nr:transposase [Gluconobacter cerinus]MBS1019582.1 transposase [Gluconobacter cerinus]